MAEVDFLDSEILLLEGVLNKLHASQRKTLNLESFRKEIHERFEEIGFTVDVKVWTTSQEGVFGFTVEPLDRIEKKPFDYDQMSYEVTEDIYRRCTGGF